MKHRLPAVLLLAATGGLAACAPKYNTERDRTVFDHDAASGNNLIDVLDAELDLTTFARLVKLGGAVQVLQTENPFFTVFAPADAAFDALPAGYLEKLEDPANKELLTAVVTYHVTEEKMPDGGVPDAVFESLYGNDLNLASTGGEIVVNDAKVVRAGLEASNGVVHVIDRVLIPQQ
ncbi:fasciclin domain-containing protein [Phycisphaera mikurensis]|uniref:FAS1 domain-containing protein n=1 Tax=Phycisphaera mikurensis (strain NBRC 102666 / KCTC 22515 / FYK2301M01) TaxID=1142394 RepID=I0ICI5_PHYMF|nr:fasciclin domain-containing protein [Phycisphaera mikurensis]MBB6442151.1 putative surface protein with fasciclin (FAS1) repeats [Phycisphaera mikurensis]BAM02973.1 hypothetical protein PSMK_08140 [Phycisphaera mikurensis NBRC 102666]